MLPSDYDAWEQLLDAALREVRELNPAFEEGATQPQPAGVSDAPRIPCARSPWHGVHPDTEKCPWC